MTMKQSPSGSCLLRRPKYSSMNNMNINTTGTTASEESTLKSSSSSGSLSVGTTTSKKENVDVGRMVDISHQAVDETTTYRGAAHSKPSNRNLFDNGDNANENMNHHSRSTSITTTESTVVETGAHVSESFVSSSSSANSNVASKVATNELAKKAAICNHNQNQNHHHHHNIGITIVHREKLPDYSSERFYLLSEIEVMGRPTIFFCTSNSSSDDSTDNMTEETDVLEDDDEDHDDQDVVVQPPPKQVVASNEECVVNSSSSIVAETILSPSNGKEKKQLDNSDTTTATTATKDTITKIISADTCNQDTESCKSFTKTKKDSSLSEGTVNEPINDTAVITTTTRATEASNNDEVTISLLVVPPSAGHDTAPSRTITPAQRSINELPSSSSSYFPPYVLLYILWKPQMISNEDDPKLFTDTVLQYALDQLQVHVDLIVPENSSSSTCNSRGNSPTNKNYNVVKPEQQTTTPTFDSATDENGTTGSMKPKVNMYVLIELVRPSSGQTTTSTTKTKDKGDDDDDHSYDLTTMMDDGVGNDEHDDGNEEHEKLDKIAESLARYIATSSNNNNNNTLHSSTNWRSTIQGITVGISNHPRAAPALEAAVQAISHGASDRRRFKNNSSSCLTKTKTNTNDHNNNSNNLTIPHDCIDKSMIGIVAISADDVLGIQGGFGDSSTDAVQDVHQRRVVAEWNGNGNIHSFAVRAHSAWRDAVGLGQSDDPSTTTSSCGINCYDGSVGMSRLKRRLPRRLGALSSPSVLNRNPSDNSTKKNHSKNNKNKNYYDDDSNNGDYDDDSNGSSTGSIGSAIDHRLEMYSEIFVVCIIVCYALFHFYNLFLIEIKSSSLWLLFTKSAQ